MTDCRGDESCLPRGIVSVLQTPFDKDNQIDYQSYIRLIDAAISGGVSGFLAPVVASEVAHLTAEEREQLLHFAKENITGRVPFIVGASADTVDECRRFARLAEAVQGDAYLVAVPSAFYQESTDVVSFFRSIALVTDLPLVIQDLEFNGPGLEVDTIKQLRDGLPTLVGMKIETVPAGLKYTAVREACGDHFFIAGGWAVTQMLEALDRGVDAMIPESAMVNVYSEIFRSYACGDRERAKHLFWKLLPILSFSNQDLVTSIAFFKRLLVRKGIFQTERIRYQRFAWDAYQQRIADELIDRYLTVEMQVQEDR